MFAEDLEAEGVDGADDGPVHLSLVAGQMVLGHDLAADALPHFCGGGVGEGDGGDVADAVVAEEGEVALDEDAGLAGAGAGGDDDVDG